MKAPWLLIDGLWNDMKRPLLMEFHPMIRRHGYSINSFDRWGNRLPRFTMQSYDEQGARVKRYAQFPEMSEIGMGSEEKWVLEVPEGTDAALDDLERLEFREI